MRRPGYLGDLTDTWYGLQHESRLRKAPARLLRNQCIAAGGEPTLYGVDLEQVKCSYPIGSVRFPRGGSYVMGLPHHVFPLQHAGVFNR
jgi:hypothetical protein